MAEGNGNGGRISVSEEKLELAFARFKNELVEEFKKFATAAAVEMIDARVKVLEIWQANLLGQSQNQRRVSDRNLAWAALLAAAIGSVSVFVWLHG